MINSIPGFLVFPTQGNISRIYADTYSQEDRLKHLADLLQRMLEWQKVSVEKINEITEVVNDSGAADTAELVQDVQALKTEMLAVQGDIATLASTTAALSTDVDAIENSIADLISRVSAVETELQNAVSEVSVSVETSENTEITFSRTKNGVSENYGNIILKSSDESILIDSVGSEIDLKAVGGSGGGGTDPALEGRVSTIENEEFVSSASLTEPFTNYGFVINLGKKTGAGVEVPEDRQADRLYLEFESTNDTINIRSSITEDNRVVLNLTTTPELTLVSYPHEAVPVDVLNLGSADYNYFDAGFAVIKVEVEFDDGLRTYFGNTVIAQMSNDGELYWTISSELSEKIQDIQPTGTVDITIFVKG